MKRLAYTRRAPRSGNSASFSLFPFLAVLICTMGVLILLLVLISQNARARLLLNAIMPQSASVEHESESELPIDPSVIGLSEDASEEEIIEKLKSEAEVAQWLTQETLVSQEDTRGQLDDARARVGMIEKNIATLVKELEKLHEAMGALAQKVQTPAEDIAKLQKTLDEKQKIKDLAEQELEKTREKNAHAEQSYAIVPYRGPNGTYRRPIYIECRGDAVIIQPEGIELQPFDFLMPDRIDNPMEMGVRTVRQYLIETQQLQRETEPYPLFLVRPSGIDAYEAALRSLGSWKGDYGYELVGEDWNLEFQQPSEELKQRLDSQIKIARGRQEGYIQDEIASGVAARGKKLQFRASSRGGIEQINGPRMRSGRGGSGNGTGTGTGTVGTGLAAWNAGAPPANPGTGNYPPTGTTWNAGVSPANPNGQPMPNGGDASMPIAAAEGFPLQQAFPLNQQEGTFTFDPNGVASNTASHVPVDPNGTGGTSAQRSSDEANEQQSNQQLNQRMPDWMAGSTESDPNFTPNAAAMPSMTFQKKSPFVKDKKPKNWAIKGQKAPTDRAVERIVRIRCDQHHYTLLKQPGLLTNRTILLNDNNTVPASERLVQAIWSYMDSWGSAGEHQFWRPLLKVQIVPGAEQQFEILKSELAESGIGIEKM